MKYVNHNPHELTRHMLQLTLNGLRNSQDGGLDGVTVRQLAEWLFDPTQGPLKEE
jgi:hypothetical protein